MYSYPLGQFNSKTTYITAAFNTTDAWNQEGLEFSLTGVHMTTTPAPGPNCTSRLYWN